MPQSAMPVMRRALVPEVLPAVMPDLPAVPEVLPAPLPELVLPERLPWTFRRKACRAGRGAGRRAARRAARGPRGTGT